MSGRAWPPRLHIGQAFGTTRTCIGRTISDMGMCASATDFGYVTGALGQHQAKVRIGPFYRLYTGYQQGSCCLLRDAGLAL